VSGYGGQTGYYRLLARLKPLGLVAHWQCNEAAGTVVHDSMGDNHGAIAFTNPLHLTAWTEGPEGLGSALNLDGSDFVEIPNEWNFDIASQITVAAWIKVRALDRIHQAIVTKGDTAWRIQRDNNRNVLQFACTGLSGNWKVLGTKGIDDGLWHHVVGAYDGSRMLLYIDGEEDASLPATGLIATNNEPVLIGENSQQQDRRWNGQIDDVQIYNRALDAEEVAQLYVLR
jgi:hypothetical protein